MAETTPLSSEEILKKYDQQEEPIADAPVQETPAVAQGGDTMDEVGTAEALTVGLAKSVGGLVAGGVEGALEGAVQTFTGEGEAFEDSYKRHEDLYKERAGRETYENTLSDMGDIFSAPLILTKALWNNMWRPDAFDNMRDMGSDIGEDATLGIRWTVLNSDKAAKAYPVSTLMMAFSGIKAASAAGRAVRMTPSVKRSMKEAEPVVSKIESVMNKEVKDLGLPDAIKQERKLVDTTEVPGTLYGRAIGDEGLTISDLVKPSLYGYGAGMLVGAPEWGAALGLGGRYIQGVLSAKSPGNRDIVGGVGRLLKHTSSQSRLSDEVAIRSLFQNAPQAAAALDTAGLMVSDAIKNGMKFTDEVLGDIGEASGLRELMDVQPSYSFRGVDGRLVTGGPSNAGVPRQLKVARGRLTQKTADALGELEQLLKDSSSEQMMGYTITALDDLLSGDSTQYARDLGVMSRAMETVRQKAPDLNAKQLRQIESLLQDVSQGPVFGRRSVNPIINLGKETIDARSLITGAWKQLDEKKRADVAGSVALSLVEDNKGIVRSIAASKALDRESLRIFRGDTNAANTVASLLASDNLYQRVEGQTAYADRLIESVFLRGDTVPMVSPANLDFNQLANVISDRYLADDAGQNALVVMLQDRLSRSLAPSEAIAARARMLEVVYELSDVGNKSHDIGKMGSELARSIVADGLQDNRVLQKIDGMVNTGLISADEFQQIKHNGLTDAFGINLQTAADGRSIRSPLVNTYWWLQNSVTNNPLLGSIAKVTGHIKSAYTILNPASHVNNAVSNIGLMAMDRALDPATVVVQAITSTKRMQDWRAGKKLPERDSRIYDKVSKMGFAEGDLISAEIRALGNMNPGYGKPPSVVTALDAAKRYGVETVSKVKDIASETYRLGDSVFKTDEAIRRMNTVLDKVDALEDGQFLDINTSPSTTTRVRREGGQIKIAGRRDIYDVASAHARMMANELFFDYSQRPGALRVLDKFGGPTSFINPYLTWYWKAMGIGGDGLFKRINNLELEYNTNNPTLLMRELASVWGKEGRKAAVINGMRSEFEKYPEELAEALRYNGDESRQFLFYEMASPNVLQYRDITNMNYLNPTGTFYQLAGTVVANMKDSDRSQLLNATGQQTYLRPLLEISGVSGGPAYDIFTRARKNRLTVEDILSPLIGVGLTQTVIAGARLAGVADSDMSSFDRLMTLPEDARNSAQEYYFRRITSIGWQKDFLFGKIGKKPGRITRYLNTLKRNLKKNLVSPVIDDARAGVADGKKIAEALTLANEMYSRRLQELFSAAKHTYPDFVFPADAVKPIKLRKTDL